MGKFYFSMIGLLALALSACVRVPAGQQLSFGSGGGITGEVTQYTLREDGTLVKVNALANTTGEPTAVGRQRARRLLRAADKLKLGQRNFNHPGNLYYFIELTTGTQRQRVTWGAQQPPVDADIQQLYQQLQALTP